MWCWWQWQWSVVALSYTAEHAWMLTPLIVVKVTSKRHEAHHHSLSGPMEVVGGEWSRQYMHTHVVLVAVAVVCRCPCILPPAEHAWMLTPLIV